MCHSLIPNIYQFAIDSFDSFLIHLRVFRSAELEKEVAILKEKIHHLDDMLKSQQRKVRHMIEQVCAEG